MLCGKIDRLIDSTCCINLFAWKCYKEFSNIYVNVSASPRFLFFPEFCKFFIFKRDCFIVKDLFSGDLSLLYYYHYYYLYQQCHKYCSLVRVVRSLKSTIYVCCAPHLHRYSPACIILHLFRYLWHERSYLISDLVCFDKPSNVHR